MTAEPLSFLSPPEEIVVEARNGRMFILVDDEDRENEGDLIIPAQMATPDAINFMAKHGRGLICLALTEQRASALGLGRVGEGASALGTAFTLSIEARHGITTGISAADRARTVSVAIDSANGPERITTPGHVFPLIARDGGVLIRAGHTEAAVDVARLAGLNPSGVICEVMNDDGSMARLPDLVLVAQRHGLKIGTIRDLIAYRRRYDHLVENVATRPFTSLFGGDWQLSTYRSKVDHSEHLVLVKGDLPADAPALVRVHAISIHSDLLGQPGPRQTLLQRAMVEIGNNGSGVVLLLSRRAPDRLARAVLSEGDPDMDIREYGIGAQILADLGIHEMILLTDTEQVLVALEGYGLSVSGTRAFTGES